MAFAEGEKMSPERWAENRYVWLQIFYFYPFILQSTYFGEGIWSLLTRLWFCIFFVCFWFSQWFILSSESWNSLCKSMGIEGPHRKTCFKIFLTWKQGKYSIKNFFCQSFMVEIVRVLDRWGYILFSILC